MPDIARGVSFLLHTAIYGQPPVHDYSANHHRAMAKTKLRKMDIHGNELPEVVTYYTGVLQTIYQIKEVYIFTYRIQV